MGGGHRDDSAGDESESRRRPGCACGRAGDVGGGHGSTAGQAEPRGRSAVRVLWAGVDGGPAGPVDVAGTATGAGGGAGLRARPRRSGVLRRGAEPDGGVGPPPAGRRAAGRPGPRWDAIVVGEYERAFYGSQYALMAPLFEHYGVLLRMPEAGGRVDFSCEHDEHAMTVPGVSGKREVTRTSIRMRTAIAVQAGTLGPPAVRVPNRRRRAAPEQGPRRLGTPR